MENLDKYREGKKKDRVVSTFIESIHGFSGISESLLIRELRNIVPLTMILIMLTVISNIRIQEANNYIQLVNYANISTQVNLDEGRINQKIGKQSLEDILLSITKRKTQIDAKISEALEKEAELENVKKIVLVVSSIIGAFCIIYIFKFCLVNKDYYFKLVLGKTLDNAMLQLSRVATKEEERAMTKLYLKVIDETSLIEYLTELVKVSKHHEVIELVRFLILWNKDFLSILENDNHH
jgi:hypothetical protein